MTTIRNNLASRRLYHTCGPVWRCLPYKPSVSITKTSVRFSAPAASPAAIVVPTAPSPPPPSFFHETGVPLVAALEKLTVAQAFLQCSVLIGATYLACYFGSFILGRIGDILAQKENEESRDDSAGVLNVLFSTAVGALYRPGSVLLPWWGTIYTLKVLAAFTDALLVRLGHDHAHTMFDMCGGGALQLLHISSQILQDSNEFVYILFFSWFVVNWKNAFLRRVFHTGKDDAIVRVVRPISTLLTWGIVGLSLIHALQAFGVNTQPLLAFGGAGTLAAGLAAQNTMANFVSAISLYTSPPFLVGDKVVLKTMTNAIIAAGIVEKVRPMRTVIRTEEGHAIYLNNKEVAALVVVNETAPRHERPLKMSSMRSSDIDSD